MATIAAGSFIPTLSDAMLPETRKPAHAMSRRPRGESVMPMPNAASSGRTRGRRPRIVIVGTGFGGLTAARALARMPADIVLIDRRNSPLFQPLLYQVATAALSPADIAWPIRAIFSRHPNVAVEMGRV